MSEHRLKPGKSVISQLSTLGKVLGYHVQREFPLKCGMCTRPAVDLAWFRDETQRFPLFIFEVESGAGNTNANNAVKVYGSSSRDFEKPLFFFHVVVKCGAESSALDSLRGQYGQANYRIYCLDGNEGQRLLEDILGQHRKLYDQLDYPQLMEALGRSGLANIDANKLCDHIESLQFDVAFLPWYARFGRTNRFFRDRYVNLLEQRTRQHAAIPGREAYNTYYGEWWGEPLHIAVLRREARIDDKTTLAHLNRWQYRNSSLVTIGPNFGLSRDYDEFIITAAPGFAAAVAAIAGSNEVRAWLFDIMEPVFEKLQKSSARAFIYQGIWLLHLAAGLEESERYSRVRDILNARGGVPEAALLNPPFHFSTELDDEWSTRAEANPMPVAPMPELIAKLSAQPSRQDDPIDVALILLTEECELAGIAPRIVNLLVKG